MRDAAPQILVVDSDVAHAASCLMLLEREGFDVTCAHDFGSAWTALKQRLPAALLTDSVIEGGDAELVMREAIRRAVPTVMMTEIAVGEINERYFRSLGAAGQWEKPLRRGDVVETLRQLLGTEYPDPRAAALARTEPATRASTEAAESAAAEEGIATNTAQEHTTPLPLSGASPPPVAGEPSASPTTGEHGATAGDPHAAVTVARSVATPAASDTSDIPAATTEIQIAPDDSDPTGAYRAADVDSDAPADEVRAQADTEGGGGPFDWDVDPMLAELSAGDFPQGEETSQQANEPTALTRRPETPPPLAIAPPAERLEDIAAAVSSDFGSSDEMSDTDFEGLRAKKSSGPVVVASALLAETPSPRSETLHFFVDPGVNRGRVGEPFLATLLTRAEKLRRTGVLEVVLPDAALSIALAGGDVSGVRVAGEGDPAMTALRNDGVLRADQWDALLRARGRTCTLGQAVMDGAIGERDALEAAHVGIARALAPAWFATEGDWAWRDGAQDVPESLVAVPPGQLVWRACLHSIDPESLAHILSPLRDLDLTLESKTPRLPLTRAAAAQFALAVSSAPRWARLSEVGERLMLWSLITDHARLR